MDMAMANSRILGHSTTVLRSSQAELGCSRCRLQLWRASTSLTGGLCDKSVGRRSNHGTRCRDSCSSRLSRKESSCPKGWPVQREGGNRNQELRSSLVAGAIPQAVTTVGTLLAIGGSLYALLQLNKDKVEAWQAKKTCETCSGSGLCPTCNGEGFNLRNLSDEAAAKARARAKDAATRYTAGLAKKWSYCTTCEGGRGCPNCEGRGWLE